MPHSKSGRLLKVGDAILIAATVSSICTGEEYCNLTVQTDEKMYPGDYATSVTLNAKQVEKADNVHVFKFSLQESVRIASNQRLGTVKTICKSKRQVGYWVEYTDFNSALHVDYFEEDELLVFDPPVVEVAPVEEAKTADASPVAEAAASS